MRSARKRNWNRLLPRPSRARSIWAAAADAYPLRLGQQGDRERLRRAVAELDAGAELVVLAGELGHGLGDEQVLADHDLLFRRPETVLAVGHGHDAVGGELVRAREIDRGVSRLVGFHGLEEENLLEVAAHADAGDIDIDPVDIIRPSENSADHAAFDLALPFLAGHAFHFSGHGRGHDPAGDSAFRRRTLLPDPNICPPRPGSASGRRGDDCRRRSRCRIGGKDGNPLASALIA